MNCYEACKNKMKMWKIKNDIVKSGPAKKYGFSQLQ